MVDAALVFPGQGAQYVGMGKELFEHFRQAKDVFQEADDVLHLAISSLCFQGPDEALKLTENTQPAVLTMSIAALRVLQAEKGVVPRLTAGHSLGEYSALVASGALAFADAVKIVRFRGKFMQETVPVGVGAMAAILGMEREQVEKLCEEAAQGEVLAPANFNCPGQIVIAGHAKAVERAMEKAKQEGKKALSLPVSAPFHSTLMKPAGERLEKVLEGIPIQDLKIPVVTNVEADINQSKERVKELLVTQVWSPVRWEESMQKITSDGIEQTLEIGPGKVLSGLMRKISPEVEAKNIEDIQTLKKIS